METETRVLIIGLVAASLIVAVLWWQPAVGERLAPEPVGAWVAIQAVGDEVATIGPVELEAGTPFRLHAVLEARDRGGRAVYYTEAPGLRFADASAAVDAASVARWDRLPHVKVRWFTVEGPQPFSEVDAEGVSTFALRTYFRADWPSSWSVPGAVDPAFDDHLDRGEADGGPARSFGTQRYHVRIELYRNEKTTLPYQRVASPDGGALPAEVARFPTVVALLPGALAPASRVFGLTQLSLPAGVSSDAIAGLRRLADAGLAFDRVTVLRDILQAAAVAVEAQRWTPIDLGARPAWGDAASAGDLLRVGDRVVVLFADRGEAGVLDYDDLCMDFVRGAATRRLGDVFSGDGLLVEVQRLTGGVLR